MRAALEDQELFDALADDETLRRYLADADFRTELLKATAPKSAARRMQWIAGVAAIAACLIAAVTWNIYRPKALTQTALSQPVEPTPVERTTSVPAVAKPAVPEQQQRRGTAAGHAVALPPPAKLKSGNQDQEVRPAPAAPRTPPPVQDKREEAVAPVVLPAPTPEQLSISAGSLNGISSPQSVAVIAGSSYQPVAGMAAPRAAKAASIMARATPIPLARVKDVNGAILTLDAGSNLGLKTGDHLSLAHAGTPIGELLITSVESEFSVGRYLGTGSPQIGDTASTPPKQ
jgi:hypothetical protein